MIPDSSSGRRKIETVEGFTEKPMVYCKLMRRYVSLVFCLRGGPMRAKGKCDYLIEIKTNKDQTFVVHAIPMEEPVMKTIVEE